MVPPRTIEIAPFFNLTLGFNTGVSFGMFRELFLDRPLMLAGIKMLIVAGLLLWAMRTPKPLETVGLGLIAGGAMGNIVDRISQGAVTDFLDFHVGRWHWPAFNMADTMITIGVVLLIAGSFWPVRSMTPVQKRPSAAEH
ncbi:Lipoprotein signal peptidase [bacterium YEK0313]|nr:Lipoprotein signal peptidase [bacterium YEK0313]